MSYHFFLHLNFAAPSRDRMHFDGLIPNIISRAILIDIRYRLLTGIRGGWEESSFFGFRTKYKLVPMFLQE